MEKYFMTRDRRMSTDCTVLVANNDDCMAVFATDEEWNGKEITARFVLPDGTYCDVALTDEKTCTIPPEVLNASGIVEVGLYSGPMATAPCRVQVDPSIKTGVVQVEAQPAQELRTYAFADSGLADVATNGTVAVTLGANQTIAFKFTGTGFDLNFHPADANIQMSVYSTEDYELKTYTYGTTTMLYASKKPGATGSVIKTMYKNYRPDTPEQREEVISDGIHGLESGEYLVVVTKFTGADAVEVLGVKILNEEEEEEEE